MTASPWKGEREGGMEKDTAYSGHTSAAYLNSILFYSIQLTLYGLQMLSRDREFECMCGLKGWWLWR
jgi:hypothetical protein